MYAIFFEKLLKFKIKYLDIDFGVFVTQFQSVIKHFQIFI